VSIAAACPRCPTALGLSRWCGRCGFDFRTDLAEVDSPESRMAKALEQRWLAANPAAAPAAWLPPEGASPPTGPGVPFAPLRTRSLLAIRWLWFAFALGIAALGVDLMWLQEHSRPDWTIDELVSVSNLMDTVAIVQVVTYVIGAVIFIFWFHRAYGNLRALGVSRLRHGRGWAIGGWFVPIANLFVPKQIANDVWRAGDQQTRVPAIVHWWWAAWLIAGMVARMSVGMMDGSDNLGEFHSAVVVDVVAQVLGVLSAVAAIAVVRGATRRQEERAAA
jgi:eukaryotic-like serine/threonine-protein kinase